MFETINSIGVFTPLRRVADTALGIIQNRIELAAVELREEKGRAVAMLGWAAAAIFFVFMGAIALTLMIVLVFRESAVIALAAFGVFYFVCALLAALGLRRSLKTPPFGETIAQFKKDREWIAGGK